MKKIERIYKNKTYILTLREGCLVSAIDSNGYKVTNSIIYHALTFLV